MRLPCFFLALITLSACNTMHSPTFMPSGYAHHGAIYKSPPAPAPHDIGYQYSPYTNEKVLITWRKVADDFVRRMEREGNLQPELVYVDSALAPSALQQTFGYALRDVMRERGYTLAQAGDQYRTRISYAARPQANISNHVTYNAFRETIDATDNGNVAYAPYILTGDVFTNDPNPVRVTNTYTLPAFDTDGLETSENNIYADPDKVMRTRNRY